MRGEERNNFSYSHVILISHVYISIFMSASKGWKSHSAYSTLNFMVVQIFSINAEAGVPRGFL